MSSKMREALKDWKDDLRGILYLHKRQNITTEDAVKRIAQRYGPLEFTREEVEQILTHLYEVAWGHGEAGENSDATKEAEIKAALYRCLGESESGDKEHSLDREVGEIQGELIELTNRVAAIEQRVLADGHSENCHAAIIRTDECTCHHDEIREQTK